MVSLQKGTHNEWPVYDIKLFDGKVLNLEIWEIWSSPLITYISSLLWPVAVDPDRAK